MTPAAAKRSQEEARNIGREESGRVLTTPPGSAARRPEPPLPEPDYLTRGAPHPSRVKPSLRDWIVGWWLYLAGRV